MCTILVFAFGGGTLDVSILTSKDGAFEVKAVDGDNYLGGEDIDQNLLQYVAKECERKHNIVLNTNERAKLKSKCEEAKLSLSTLQTAEITLDGLTDGKSFNMTISRARFNDINADLFNMTMMPVNQVLSYAGKTPEDIDSILLVGGSTCIPKIQQLLQEIFKGKKLSHGINPTEAVACGAAVQAAMLMKDQSNEIRKLTISDVIPLSLGVDIKGDMMLKIIKRSSKIPTKNSQYFVTTEDNQTRIHFRVLEGERLMAADNNTLGHFVLHGLPPAPKGEVTACVTFEVDDNGVLTVSAVEEKTGSRTQYTVTNDRQQVSYEELNRMIKQAEQFKIDDENQKQCATLKKKLEGYIFEVQKALKGTLKTKISNSDKITVSIQCDNTRKWIKENPKAPIMELKRKKELLENLWDEILKKPNTK